MALPSPISWGCIAAAGNAFRPLVDRLVIVEILSYPRVELSLFRRTFRCVLSSSWQRGTKPFTCCPRKARRQSSV